MPVPEIPPVGSIWESPIDRRGYVAGKGYLVAYRVVGWAAICQRVLIRHVHPDWMPDESPNPGFMSLTELTRDFVRVA